MILSSTQNNKEFDSQMTLKRKTMESLTVNCHFVPVPCIGNHPTHLLILFNTSLVLPESDDVLAVLPSTGQFHQQPQQFQQHLSQSHQPIKPEPRGSLHSVRRGSFDIRSVASEGIRRTSLAKLSALPLEAPITKVRNIWCSFIEIPKSLRVFPFSRWCQYWAKFKKAVHQMKLVFWIKLWNS